MRVIARLMMLIPLGVVLGAALVYVGAPGWFIFISSFSLGFSFMYLTDKK